MPERVIKGLFAIAWALAIVGVASCAADAGEEGSLSDEQRALNAESFDYVWTTIRDKHFDPDLMGVDWDAVRDELRPRAESAETMRGARRAMDEMIERLGQSHFNVIPDEVYEALEGPGGALDGVTGLDARVFGGHALVTRVHEGSAAAEAGVRPGWEIMSIGDKELASMIETIAEEFDGQSWKNGVISKAVVMRLRGTPGEKVTAVFLDENEKKIELEIDRREDRGVKSQFGHLPPMYVWAESDVVDGDVGYITFNMWLDPVHVMPTINKAMKSYLESEVAGVIIDVRGNGGGLPGMAMGVAGWLVEEKNKYLGTMKTRDTELKIIVNPRATTFAGPVVVLVDELSGSCSEMFSGGMQDIGRARIIGRTTMGAVLPSTIEKLPNGDGFQYAFANYTSADGDVLEGIGVIPDVEVVPTREVLLEGRDPAMEEAISWIRSQ
jgi:carboxyl-terminal processing protease